MKFIKGLLLGSIAGFAAGAALSERQRQELAERVARATRRRTDPSSFASRPVGDAAA
jgi:hypothetical protein